MARTLAPSPRRRAARLSPDARRAQLLTAALGAFAERGLGGTRLADVATAATVSLPTVFFYFPTRDALVDAVLDEVETFYRELIGRATASAAPADEVLLGMARAFADSVRTHPDHARVWLNWSTALRGTLWPRYRRFQRRLIDVMASTIARGQREGSVDADLPAEDVALLYVGAAYVVIQLAFARTPKGTVDRFLRSLVTSTTHRARPARRDA